MRTYFRQLQFMETEIRTFFAWRPVRIELEERWLERVTVRYEWNGSLWRAKEFVDFAAELLRSSNEP